MPDAVWVSQVYFFALESILESAIIYLIVRIVWRVFKLRNPAMVSRFLLLPLVIPVLLSPILHMLFPPLEPLALIEQIEHAFPMLEVIQHRAALFAPLLLIVFVCLFGLNVAQWLVVALREARSDTPGRSLHSVQPATLAARLADQFGVHHPQLIVSQRRPGTAHVFGLRRPIIVLGQNWLTRLDSSELEAVVAHELAHFKRGDNWQMLIAKVCRDVMFFNPLAQHIYRELSAAREEAADDLALRITHQPMALASCLLKFCRGQQLEPTGAGSSLVEQPHDLESRIQRLIANAYMDQLDQEAKGLFYALLITLTLVLSVV